MAELETNIIPYGVQNFADLRRRGLYYVDKTLFIRELELRSDKVFFVRPRRMGKSLFVDMLAHYYDIAGKDDFQDLFGGLAIGARPTAYASSFYVLKLDFSKVNSCSGKTLEDRFNTYMAIAARAFVDYYRPFFDESLRASLDAMSGADVLSFLLETMPQKGLPLYIIIDEYDNFTNQMLKVESVEPYRSITHGDGFYREWFKKFKAGATRLFMTGVSPVTMDDLTSGFNVATNCSQDPGLNAMIGFTRDEVRQILTDFNGVGKCRFDVETCLAELERLYDGYCFSRRKLAMGERPKESVFNSSMTFYYLLSLVVQGEPPENVIDRNIRSDWGKLDYLLALQRHLESFDGVLPLTEELAAGREVTFELVDAFQVKDIADEVNFKSLYYYYGIITMSRIVDGDLYFKVPNECVRRQVLEYMRAQYARLPDAMDLAKLARLHSAFARHGDWKPFFNYVAKRAEALQQLKAYSSDPVLPSLTAGTPTHYLYIHYQDFDQIACEEICFE